MLTAELSHQQFECLADLVVRDRGERAGLAEAFGGLAEADAIRAEGVRVVERVEEHVRRRADGQCLPDGQLHDRGHGLLLAADNGVASRTPSGV
ncbi:hypothetical protein GCM10009654_29770 [Streptomyces hebeiensis]|uniref:Uncharacterized protein n=1 Tax=Streptomyces hebeiensis TaxID=229486 RepID=A0ABP4FF86_9ACTN